MKRKDARSIYEKENGPVKKWNHVHHIIPVHLGGTNDIDNLLSVSPEWHYMLHYDAYKETGSYCHLMACKLLQTNHLKLSKEEKTIIASKGGKAAQKTLKKRKISAYYDPKLKSNISSKGGKNGSFTIDCIMREGYSRKEAEKIHIERQSSRGKRGGVKNKGFVWLTDGKNNIKYSKTLQKEKSIERYIKENPQYRVGRKLPGYTYINDGKTNIRYSKKREDEMSLDDFLLKNTQYKIGKIYHANKKHKKEKK